MGYRREDGAWIDPCLEKLKHGEPFFVLRAQDKLAARVVEIWAVLADFLGSPEAKVQEAKETAVAMELWGVGHRTKVPD